MVLINAVKVKKSNKISRSVLKSYMESIIKIIGKKFNLIYLTNFLISVK